MHYYATYCIARLAGINKDASTIIANASQYVDDNSLDKEITLSDGSSFQLDASAYGMYDKDNWDSSSQKKVWLPFHFLPGNSGDNLIGKLACQKNSPIVNEMCNYYLSQSTKPYYLELLGIMCHVFADTFSHYGFSGVSSKNNRVSTNSFKFKNLSKQVEDYIVTKKNVIFSKFDQCFQDIESVLAEDISGALGHAGAVTFPDRPYLNWYFEYENSNLGAWRDNVSTYLEYCKNVYFLFSRIIADKQDISDGSQLKNWDSVQNKIQTILQFQGSCEDRIKQWQTATTDRTLFWTSEEIPTYKNWNDDFMSLKNLIGKTITNSPVFKFSQAASFHRHYVLYELLPHNDIVVL